MNKKTNPNYYRRGGIECLDVITATQGIAAAECFCIGNAFKYIYRHKMKDGDADIGKAIWYLTKYLELREREEKENEAD